MKLSIGERYILGELLPKEGSFKTLKILRNLREALSYSEEDIKTYKMTEEPDTAGGITLRWDVTVPDAEIEIGAQANAIIVESLAKLDAAGKITNREFGLYEKFIETGGE
jgi:hypothetical protein